VPGVGQLRRAGEAGGRARVTGSMLVPRGGGARCADCLRPDPPRVVFNRKGNGIQALYVRNRNNGRFRGTLPPGVYLLRAFPDQPGGGLCRPATWIRITAGKTVHLRLICIWEIGVR